MNGFERRSRLLPLFTQLRAYDGIGPRTDIALIIRSPRRRERGVSRAPLARANTGTKTGAKMAHLAIAGVKNYRTA
jgi:hypothetical protein